ncbi:MAG: glycosyltransferase family 2 protein [bacterium]|nr:glycosyltransferase family 2 protein [bacterium]
MIPALHEAGRICAAVRSAHGPEVDVIVSDGGSVDATAQRARREGARVVHSEPGRARQMAAGAEAAAAADSEAAGPADVICFLHADTHLPPRWSDAVRRALADPEVAGGAFAFRFSGEGARLRFIEAWVRLRVRLFGLPYGDQALFVRRSVLEAMGGVPQVPLMEDLDLVRGLKRHGRLALLREAVATSPRRYERRGFARTLVRNLLALAAWRFGIDRSRVAAWYRR